MAETDSSAPLTQFSPLFLVLFVAVAVSNCWRREFNSLTEDQVDRLVWPLWWTGTFKIFLLVWDVQGPRARMGPTYFSKLPCSRRHISAAPRIHSSALKGPKASDEVLQMIFRHGSPTSQQGHQNPHQVGFGTMSSGCLDMEVGVRLISNSLGLPGTCR